MKRIIPIQILEHQSDIQRIVEICSANGIFVTGNDACQIWEDHSEALAATWMTLPAEDVQVLQIVLMCSQEMY